MQRGEKTVRKVKVVSNYGAQYNFVKCLDKFVLFASGFAGGKTFGGATKAVDNSLIRFRGRNGLVVAPTYADLETFVIPELLLRFEQYGVKAKFRAKMPQFITYNIRSFVGRREKAKIYLRSGTKPESIAGFEVAWCWIDEAARINGNTNPVKDVKTQCIGRMRGVDLEDWQMFVTTTHEGELTWVCNDWMTQPKPDHTYFRGSTFDNPAMQDFARGLMRQYDPKLVIQYVYGNPVTLGGLRVYYEFINEPMPSGHLNPNVELDFTQPIALTMDFNAAPGMHAVIGQYDQERDKIKVWDEITGVGMNVPEMINQYKKRLGDHADTAITWVYGDATSNARNAATGETDYWYVWNALQRNKLSYKNKVRLSNPPVNDRYNTTNAAMNDGSGHHVEIHPRCKCLIRDFNGVQRNNMGIVDRDQQKKGLTHAADAFDYWLFSIRSIVRLPLVRGQHSVAAA